MNIIIYTKNGCPNCDSAKQLLAAKSLPYTAHNVETMEGLAAFVPAREKYPAIRQMPAIIINDQYVGGLAGLQAALKQLNL